MLSFLLALASFAALATALPLIVLLILDRRPPARGPGRRVDLRRPRAALGRELLARGHDLDAFWIDQAAFPSPPVEYLEDGVVISGRQREYERAWVIARGVLGSSASPGGQGGPAGWSRASEGLSPPPKPPAPPAPPASA